MRRRTLPGIGATVWASFIGLGFAARIFSLTPEETVRRTSWNLAREAIRASSARPQIPEFVNWPTAREIYPCGIVPAKQVTPQNLLDESFHYNLTTATRLCGPLTRAPGAPPMDRALSFWNGTHPKPLAIDPPFPTGAQLSAAFWNPVRLPADSSQGKIVELPVRSGSQTVTRRIRITIPERIRNGPASCDPPISPGQPAAPGVKDVSIDNFFWIRLNRGERYNGASCGDFAVLVAFHLVHKYQGKWLWTTFWWDPESQDFGANRPHDFKGAGDNPRAWANYAMDASFDSNGTIFNPWRIEERPSNCAQCHREVTVYPDATAIDSISFDSVTTARAHFK
jgi:hypothetical protein